MAGLGGPLLAVAQGVDLTPGDTLGEQETAHRLGALVGAAWIGGVEGATAGAVGALMLWLVLLIVSLSGGDKLILMSARAREIKKEDAPVLWNVVEEMTIAGA